jgi:hypothetical protein
MAGAVCEDETGMAAIVVRNISVIGESEKLNDSSFVGT